MGPPPPEWRQKNLRQCMDRILAMLSSDQRARWKEMTGEPYQGPYLPHRGPPGPPGMMGPGGRPPHKEFKDFRERGGCEEEANNARDACEAGVP